MGKEKKLYELAAANLELNGEGSGQGLSREDRKNQHVLRMIQRQEKQKLRKEERKKQQMSSGGPTAYHKEARSRDRSTQGLSSQNVVHRPSAVMTSARSGAHQGYHHHQSKHHRSNLNSKIQSLGKEVPPIEVHFSDNVAQEKNNMYFFRRKKSFEERQRAAYALLAQQLQYKQDRLARTAMAFTATIQGRNEGYAQDIRLQNHQHHQNQVHLSNCQHQQQQYAAHPMNYGASAHQLRPHQSTGLSVGAVNALVGQRQNQSAAIHSQTFRTAGTGGMYDPISDDPSGAPSSVSSASKVSSSSVQQGIAMQSHPQLRSQSNSQMIINEFGGEGHHNYQRMSMPRNQQLLIPNKPSMRILQPTNGGMAVSLLPQHAFAANSDSSEPEDSSGSFQRQSVLSTQNRLLNVQQTINAHLLYPGQMCPGEKQFSSSDLKGDAKEEDEDQEHAMNKMMEKTREAQRQLQSSHMNTRRGSSNAML